MSASLSPAVAVTELWRRIPDWPHEASTQGRVRRLSWLDASGTLHLGGILAQHADKRPGKGYLYVTLLDGQRRRKVHVAAAVLEAHRGLKPPGCEARHGNGVRTDNRLDNLSWGTKRQNRADRERHRIERAGSPGVIPASPGHDLISVRQAIAAGWFPSNWSIPITAFSAAKRRAAEAGEPVPAVRARDGSALLYDATEFAEFLCSVTVGVTKAAGNGHERYGSEVRAGNGTSTSGPVTPFHGDGETDTGSSCFPSYLSFVLPSVQSFRSLRSRRRVH